MKELSFDVTSPNDYNHFLRNFVTRMRRELAADYVYQVPRLPRQVDVQVETPEFVDLILHARTDQVTLRLRTDNLYVVGFSNAAADSRWFEFASNHRQIIQGSTRLRYQGSYRALGDLSQDLAILGRLASEHAIHVLASYDGANDDDWQYRGALRTLIVNFIESIRFHSIANRVARLMHPTFDVSPNQQLTGEEIVNIRNWGHASGFLMMSVTAESIPSSWQTASIPESWWKALQDVNGTFRVLGVEDPTAASSLLGMALFSMTSSSQCSGQRPRRSVGTDDVDDVSGSMGGIVLVEVIGVKILRINDYDPGKLYGTISITDGFGTCQLYNRDKDNTQSVGPGGWADLVGPTRAISGADDFAITLDLKDHYTFFLPDREVEHGVVPWNSHDTVPGDFNKVKKVQVNGEHGSVEVHYAVLTDAVIANVMIVVGDDGESTLDVYGDVTATITMVSGEPLPCKLFNKDRSNEVKVPKGNDIPLQKKVISVPLCSKKLILQAELQDSKSFSPDKQIAHGSVSFTPRYIGTYSKEITGASGNVRVQVTWSI